MPSGDQTGRQGGLYPHIPHYVYLATDGHLFKIGFSKNPIYRVKMVGRETKRSMRLVHITKGYCDLENRLHRRYAHRRVEGEWFALTAEDIAEIKAEYPFCRYSPDN